MNSVTRQSFSVPAALLTLALGSGLDSPARAAAGGAAGNAASRDWQCSLCPEPGGLTGEADLGAGWVSDPSPKFGDFRGLDEDGGFLALDAAARYRDGAGRFLDVRVSDLGIDRRSLEMRGGERGRYTMVFAYRQIPKYRGFGAETVFRGAGGPLLTLPPDWLPAPTTDGMTGLGAALQPEALDLERTIVDFGFRWRLTPRWSYDLEFQHQVKEGTRPFGAGVFTIHASHFPAPVDFSVNRLDMGLSWAGEAAHWRLGIAGSDFDNAYPAVTWPNPFRAVPGTELLRASLEPDNRFYQVNLAGSWALVQRLRFSVNAAAGRMEQDQPLLPPSINPDFSDVPLPRATAGARIDVGTLNLGGKLDARLSPRLGLTARWRRDERDNRTPVALFTPIITDILPRQPSPNRPYSFRRDHGSVSVRYRAGPVLRFQAGADVEDIERTLQSVFRTEETGFWGQVGIEPGSRLGLRVRLERSKRDAGPYTPPDDQGLIEHPLMRKFNLADRTRRRLRVDLDLFPLPELTLGASYWRSDDTYSRSVIGLRASDDRAISLDLGWSPAQRLHAHAFLSLDKIASRLSGAESAGAAPWDASTDDRFLTAGAGVEVDVGRRHHVGLELVRAQSEGDIRTVGAAGGGAFPTLETDLTGVTIYAEYSATARWGLNVRLEYESYDSTDWALDGLGSDSLPAILTFGADSPDYDVLAAQVQARYRF